MKQEPRQPGPTRLGRFLCVGCDRVFWVRPGPHPTSHCPDCGSLYYEWLDYRQFALTHGNGPLHKAP
jgi:hypothetical protein